MRPHAPYNGDIVYVDDTSHPEYGQRGLITKSVEGRVYSYDCDYDYTIQLDNGKTIVLSSDDVSYDEPLPKKERLERRAITKRKKEIEELDRAEKRIKARRKELGL